jgi:hypothetical protein
LNNKSDKSKIARFKLESILEAKDGDTVKPEHKSKSEFNAWCESSLLILPNQKTVIGIDSTGKKLIMEDITDDCSPVQFGRRKEDINTLIFMEESNMLLAGGDDEKIIQYHLDSEKKVWNQVKEYELGIGQIKSSVRIGHLVICGARGTYKIRVLDSQNMKILGKAFKTAIQDIFSLSIGEISDSKILLSISGCWSNYSSNKSDIVDITDLVKANNVKLKKRKTKIKKSEFEETSTTCSCNFEMMIREKINKVEYKINEITKNLIRSIKLRDEGR